VGCYSATVAADHPLATTGAAVVERLRVYLGKMEFPHFSGFPMYFSCLLKNNLV